MSDIISKLQSVSHPLVNISKVSTWAIKVAPIDIQESLERTIDGERCITKAFEDYRSDEKWVREDFQAPIDLINKLNEYCWQRIDIGGIVESDHQKGKYIVVLSMTIKPGSVHWRQG